VLLVVPSQTYRASEFLDAAIRLGVDVVCASDSAQAMAATAGDRFLELRLDDPDDAARTAERFASSTPIDAVVAVDDAAALTAAHVAARLGIGRNPVSAIEATRDKAQMRRRFSEADVDQPAFAVVAASGHESDDVERAATLLGFPAVVKPVSLSASRGVERVDDADAAQRAAKRVREVAVSSGCPSSEPLLVEAYVEGDEIALEGMLTEGELQTLAVFDKPDPLTGPFFEETIYVTPSRHHPDLLRRAEQEIARACAAIGLADGPVHAEARLSPSGARADARVAVLEAAARTIGGKCAKALRFSSDRSLEELVLAHALGVQIASFAREDAASGVMMIPIPVSGRLDGIDGRDEALAVPGITGLDITVPIGKTIRAWPEGDRYLGFLFARARNPEDVEHALREAHARLAIRVTKEPAA
jgi:biotin carboxylase